MSSLPPSLAAGLEHRDSPTDAAFANHQPAPYRHRFEPTTRYLVGGNALGCVPAMNDTDRPIFGGRYELYNRLARGGMSEVFLGRDQVLDRPVAVKVLFREFATDSSFVERFRREAQAAAALSHMNVIGIYDWGDQDGTQYIVMEYADGQNLAEIIRSQGPLDPRRAADIAIDICAALSFAHTNDMIHRDIKPGNVLTTPEGRVKVADFGIARALTSRNPDLTQTGSVMGTATYLSPEQSKGYEADQRSDIYSLSVVLYEMLTAGPPFTGDNAVAIAYKHVSEEPLPPRHFNNNVPAALEAVCLHGLQKDPEQRYASVEEMLSDLQSFRSGSGAPIAEAAQGAIANAAAAGLASAGLAGAGSGGGRAAGTPGGGAPGGAAGDRTDPLSTGGAQHRRAPAGQGSGSPANSASPTGAAGPGGSIAAGGAAGGVAGSGAGGGQSRGTAGGVGGGRGGPGGSGGVGGNGPNDYADSADGSDGTTGEQLPISPPDRTPVWIAVLVVLLIVIAGLVFLLVSSVDSSDQASDDQPAVTQLRVPSLLGLNWEDAEDLLNEEGFEYIVIEFEDRSDVEKNEVFRQNPRSGELIDPTGTTATPVALFVSKGPNTVRIPEVTNRRFVEAEQLLVSAGFTVDRIDIRSDEVGTGIVIEQSVPSTQERPQGTIITLTVSTGRGEVAVPNVEGQTFEDARVALARAGLIERVERAYSTLVPVNSVISTDPSPGSGLSRGSVVTLLLSDGPEELVVPTIAALGSPDDPQEILASLEALGFTSRIHDPDGSQASGQPHRVIGLDPVPGSLLLAGSEVLVLVGFESGNAVVPTIDSLGTTIPDEVVAKLNELGFRTVLAEREVPLGNLSVGEVIALDPQPGTQVNTDSQVIAVIVGIATASN